MISKFTIGKYHINIMEITKLFRVYKYFYASNKVSLFDDLVIL